MTQRTSIHFHRCHHAFFLPTPHSKPDPSLFFSLFSSTRPPQYYKFFFAHHTVVVQIRFNFFMVFNFPKNGNSDFSLFVPTLWHRPCPVRSSKVSHLRILHHLATTHTACAPRYHTPVTAHTFLCLHYWADTLNQTGSMKRK